MRAELSSVIGAVPHERTEGRLAQRNGTGLAAGHHPRGLVAADPQAADRVVLSSLLAFPYVFLDATYCTGRANRRVVSQAVVVATGVRADGWLEVLGFAFGDSANRQARRAVGCRRRRGRSREGCGMNRPDGLCCNR